MATHLVWFRNDLRIKDNLALYHACANSDANVIAVFISTPEQWHEHNMSPRQAWFIEQHLVDLQKNLNELSIPLFYLEEQNFIDQKNRMIDLCHELSITDLFYNKQYQWNEYQRDNQLAKDLRSSEISIHCFDDETLFPPGSILNNGGEMYKVYTPYRTRCIERLQGQIITVLPKPKPRINNQSVQNKRFKNKQVNINDPILFTYPCDVSLDFPVGENLALSQLRQFCREDVADYLIKRDIPSINATSRLSPYLAIGVISPRQCIARLQFEFPAFLFEPKSGAFAWFNEIIWREFYKHLLVAFPNLSRNRAFIPWTENINWNNDENLLIAWQNGMTGYPIVDAAMRQLNQTGWMHNRLRMVVASFLVKDLCIDWRKGEAYFMSTLIDGELAANNGGWQWAASTGVDSAPYFRVFNPITQSKRFDLNGSFIRQYLPELNNVPDEALHEPQKWAKKAGVNLNYPQQIVDHKISRIQILDTFDRAKNRFSGTLAH